MKKFLWIFILSSFLTTSLLKGNCSAFGSAFEGLVGEGQAKASCHSTVAPSSDSTELTQASLHVSQSCCEECLFCTSPQTLNNSIVSFELTRQFLQTHLVLAPQTWEAPLPLRPPILPS